MTGQYGSVSSNDTGQSDYPGYSAALHTCPAGIRVYNGSEFRKANRQAPETDVDAYPWLIRRYTNVGVTEVQLNNGLRDRIATGLRFAYPGSNYMYGVNPIIPGQMRDNVAGWHRRGPSPYNVADIYMNGPGSQPSHPGGPGKIAAALFVNPMTG
jgi:hypothetical protein